MDATSVSLITTLFLVFIAAIVGAICARWLKIPAILGYIAAGVLFGNSMTRVLNTEFLKQIADVGVTLLLFTLGVEFSFRRLRQAFSRVLWLAVLQLVACMFVFLYVFLLFGFSFVVALYIAVAAALSSTAVVVSVLSQKGELETVPGEQTTAWLVIQDLSVVPIMIVLPALATFMTGEQLVVSSAVAIVVGKFMLSAGILAAIWFLGRKGVPRVLSMAASSQNRELFLLSVIAIVFLSAIVTYAAGLSAALGAFIAGLLISETSQNHAIFSEVRPLRDVFAVIFFVSLGFVLRIDMLMSMVPILLAAAGIVLMFKTVLVYTLARYAGNHRKTAFLVSLALAQMSEFGFIIGQEGLSIGALDTRSYVFMVGLTFLTIFAGASALSNGHSWYYAFIRIVGSWLPKLFPEKKEDGQQKKDLPYSGHIVICGYGRMGKYIGRALDMAHVPYVVVDYDEATVHELRQKGVTVVFGDPADTGVLDYAQVDTARAVIIAIPDAHTQQMIITSAQTLNRNIHIICRTHHEEDQKWLKSLGVTTIVQPEFEAALSVTTRLLAELGITADDIAGKVHRLKIEHGLG